MGRLFGLAAMVRAGCVRSAPAASLVISSLLGLAHKRTFLREAAANVVLELLLGGPPRQAAGGGGAAEGTPARGAKPKCQGGGSSRRARGGQTWLEEEDVKRVLGAGPGSCEVLRKFMSCQPQDACPEVCLGVQVLRWSSVDDQLHST